MASVRLLLGLALLCASATTVFGGGNFRWWTPPKRVARILPILECVILDGDYYIAHFGYENQDTSVQIVNTTDNDMQWSGQSKRPSNCATRFVFPNIFPGRPGRTGLYPNTAFNIRIKKGIIGFWKIFGKYLIITHLGPKCSQPDTVAPRFISPVCSDVPYVPFRYQVTADPGKDSGTLRKVCFTATDNDGSCQLNYRSEFFGDDDACNRCLDDVELPGFGEHPGAMTVTDGAGNKAICPVILNLVDKEAPIVKCNINIRSSLDVGITDSYATTYNLPAGNLFSTADDNNPAFGKDGSGEIHTYSISAPTSRTGTGKDAAGSFAFGSSTVTFTSKDIPIPPLAANSGMCQSKINVNDRAKPVFTVCPADIITKDADKGTTTATVVIAVSATDTLSKFTISYRRAGVSCSSAASVSSIKGNPKETKSLSISSAFSVGTTTLSVYALDDAKNVANCTVTVKINPAPVNPPFTCPTSVTNTTAAGLPTQVVNSRKLTGTFTNVNYDVTYESTGSTRISGTGLVIPTTTFNVSLTTITFTGYLKNCRTTTERAASKFTCSFTVNIVDAEAPKILFCPADFTVGTVPDTTIGLPGTALIATASDNVGVILSNSLNDDAIIALYPKIAQSSVVPFLPLGTTSVTFTVNDDAGNTRSNCTTKVTVVDTEAPRITCPANITRDSGLNAEFSVVTEAEATAYATDNLAAVLSWTSSLTPTVVTTGDSAEGQYLVGTVVNTFVATDAAGNTATCKQVVTITPRAYCDPQPCQNGGTCSVNSGPSGFPVGFTCDCSALGCYSKKFNGDLSCSGSPFQDVTPQSPSRSVSACPVVIVAEPNCATSTAGVTRSWVFVSAAPTDETSGVKPTDANNQLITDYLKTVGGDDTVTFAPIDLIPGLTYSIALVYTHPTYQPPSLTYYTLIRLTEQVSPMVTISGPPSPIAINSPIATNIRLQSLLTTCGANITASTKYIYTWTVVQGLFTKPLSPTNLPYLDIPLSSGVDAGLYIFNLTIGDGYGNDGWSTFSITYVPDSSSTGDPCNGFMITPPVLKDNTFITITTNNVMRSIVNPSNAVLNRLTGSTPTKLDASAFSDPAYCSKMADYSAPLEFRWVITYPGQTDSFSDQGVTGYRTSVLSAIPGGLANQPFPFVSNGPGAQFLLTVYSPNSKMTTTVDIRAQVISSALTLSIYNACLGRVTACATTTECLCTIAAALPTTEPTREGFALMDASSEWVWSWTSMPYLDLAPWGGNTATLEIPTSGMQLGAFYTFQVSVTNGIVSGDESTTIYYYNNMPNSTAAPGDQFIVIPPTGAALTQEFVLECHGWSASSVLQYSFKYIPEGGNETDEIGLTSALWVPSTSVYLPAGNITLVAYITSPVDGSYTRTTAKVYVSQPSTGDRACWVLSIVETIITTAEAQQANSLSLTLVFYLADYLNDPALSTTSLTCDGVDKSADLLNLRQRFLAILKRIADSSSLDSNSAAMITSTIMKVVSKIDTTSSSASDAAKLITTVVNGMSSAGASGNSITQTQNNVLSLVSHLVDYIEDCSVLDSLSYGVRNMFALSLGTSSAPGTRTNVLEATNVQMVATSVWANHPQAAYLGDKLFNFPTAALLSSSDSSVNVNMVNFAGSQVKKCRATDVRGRAVAVVSDILDVELVSPTTGLVRPVTGLSAPVVFTMPVTTAISSRTCGVGQGSMSCAWWDNNRRGWSSSGCTLVNPSVTMASGEKGVQCSCYTVTEVALVRSSITCLDAAHTYGFRVMVVLYGFLLAIAGGLFFRTVRTSHFELRESLVFTLMACVSCVVRMVCATHYSQYFALPTGVVDVLMVIPFAIIYWINSHYFKQVRLQRYLSTHSHPRWRVEPVLRCVTIGVFLGTLVLLAGIGLDVDSQAQLALVCVRAIALTMLAANTIYFGYSVAIIAGLTSGRSNKHLTRSLVLMSFASLMQSIFWGAWPISGNSLFPCCGFDLLALGTLLYKYKDPKQDLDNSRASAMFTRAPGVVASDLSITDGDLASPKRGSEFTAPLAAGGPRSSEFAIDSPRRPSTQLAEPPAVEPQA